MEKQKIRVRIIGIDADTGLHACAGLIREAFADVAGEYGLSASNCPSHPAFIKTEKLIAMQADGAVFLGLSLMDRLVGLAAVTVKGRQCRIEKLCILPEYRHRGFGGMLMEAAQDSARERGCRKASIGIIDENRVLKDWYAGMGFRVTETKKFGHLPFTVCMMEKALSD